MGDSGAAGAAGFGAGAVVLGLGAGLGGGGLITGGGEGEIGSSSAVSSVEAGSGREIMPVSSENTIACNANETAMQIQNVRCERTDTASTG